MASVPSENPTRSPYDRIKRVRRCAAAIEQGTAKVVLTKQRRFTEAEYDEAVAMLEEKARKKANIAPTTPPSQT